MIDQESEDTVLTMREIYMLLELVSYKIERIHTQCIEHPDAILTNVILPLNNIMTYMIKWFENYDGQKGEMN